jgi:Carboxypeptidase regulatory-like domain
MRTHLRSLALSIVVPLLLAACAGSAAPATPTPSRGGGIDSPAAAVKEVISAHPEFAAIGPFNTDRIGQCCWYEAVEAPGGYQVTIHVGWGDCPAGCIDKHEWTFAVSATDGSVALLRENGPPVPAGVPGGGGSGGPGGSGGGSGSTGIAGKAVAGPTCPVVRENDPSCNPRPVRGAVVIVKSLDGTQVARVETDAAGVFRVALPPGSYTVESDRTSGFPMPPAPVAVTVVPNVQTAVQLEFDTGIR